MEGDMRNLEGNMSVVRLGHSTGRVNPSRVRVYTRAGTGTGAGQDTRRKPAPVAGNPRVQEGPTSQRTVNVEGSAYAVTGMNI